MKLIHRLIGAMLAVSLGLGVQVFGPTLLPYLATDAVADDLLPALIPDLTLSASTDDGFLFTVVNFDPDFAWVVSSSQGGLSFRPPATASPFVITVKRLPPGTSATITVTTSREGYTDGSASIIGSSRTPAVAIPVPTATSTPSPSPTPTPTSSPTPTPAPNPSSVPTETPIPTQAPSPAPMPVSTPAASPTSEPAPVSTPTPTPTVSASTPPAFDPTPEMGVSDQQAKDMQHVLAEDALETSADVVALTQRIVDAITNQNRAEDRRMIANAKALAKGASKALPKARTRSSRLSLLTGKVRRTLRN